LWEEQRFKDAHDFLGEFLKQRAASYTADDVLKVAKEMQISIKDNKQITKLTWVGSFPSGLGNLGKSDIDITVNTFDGEYFVPDDRKSLAAQIVKRLEAQSLEAFAKGGVSILQSDLLLYLSGRSRIMIEVTPDKIYLKLYSSDNNWTQHEVIAAAEPLTLEVK
jgi:hypothetical protein